MDRILLLLFILGVLVLLYLHYYKINSDTDSQKISSKRNRSISKENFIDNDSLFNESLYDNMEANDDEMNDSITVNNTTSEKDSLFSESSSLINDNDV